MVEPVESAQESQEPIKDSRSKKNRLKIRSAIQTLLSIIGAVTALLIAIPPILNELGTSDFVPQLMLKNAESKSPQTESQTETVESTEPWSAVFKTRDENQKEPEVDEILQLSFKDGNVEGNSISRVDGEDKKWAYSGQKDGNYLALSYRGINTSTLGTVLMEQVADGKYIGYWEGKLCSDSSIIIRCPYVLVKGDSADLHPKQVSHLTKSCTGTEFNADSDETLTKNPCL